MNDRPYRVSICAADCCGVAHGDACPAGAAYWRAHERDRRTPEAPSSSPVVDDAAVRFSLMELD